MLYHSNIFDVEDETIYCRIDGNPKLLKGIEEGEFRFLYYAEEGFLPIENCQVVGKYVLLTKQKPNRAVMVNQHSYSVFVLEAKEPQKESITIDSISFSSAGALRYVPYVGNGTTNYSVERFCLFGGVELRFCQNRLELGFVLYYMPFLCRCMSYLSATFLLN